MPTSRFCAGSLLGSISVVSRGSVDQQRVEGRSLWPTVLGEAVHAVANLMQRGRGADLVECFALAVYLEENASRQCLALQIGKPRIFNADEITACRANLWKPSLFQRRGTTTPPRQGVRGTGM
jgi:hypothetical protein